ncbi:hypothetical protein STA3757_18560 [Stanieria sp. NIES-3757]|nr:hypothetical protein STA3757_18560 [Stanieria sp. NIES-3757]
MPIKAKFFLIILLLIGIFFRFSNLDHKVYGFDESYTLLRTTGYTEQEIEQTILNDRRLDTISDLKKFHNITNHKSVIDIFKSLAKEEPHFPPLYFLSLRYWVNCFGNSVTSIRSFSALLSVLTLPSIYWLSMELFSSSWISWLATGLLAVSPFHVLYAQEARPYSLWILLIILASASLIRALRIYNRVNWAIYTLLNILSLYTYLYGLLTIFAHTLYILLYKKFSSKKIIKFYILSSISSLLIFSIWPIFVLLNRPSSKHVEGFFNNSATRFHLLNRWATNFTRIFVDFGGYKNELNELLLVLPFIILIILLIGFAIYFVYRYAPRKVWLFIGSLIGVQVVFLMLPDLILGRWRFSGETRYLIPSYLAVELAVAFLLSQKLINKSPRSIIPKIWKCVTVFLISMGIYSCIVINEADTWWNKAVGQTYLEVADLVNQSNNPLIISDAPFPNGVIVLADLVNPQTQFLLIKTEQKFLTLPEKFNEIFLYNPSQSLITTLKQQDNIKLQALTTSQENILFKLQSNR